VSATVVAVVEPDPLLVELASPLDDAASVDATSPVEPPPDSV